MPVDVGKLRDRGTQNKIGVVERQGSIPVHLGGGIGIDGVAVGVARGQVDPRACQCQVERLSGGTHGEHKPTVGDEPTNLFRHGPLEGRHVRLTEPSGHRFVLRYHGVEPGGAGVIEEELGVLAGKIFMVEMEPVVLLQSRP